MDKISQGKNIKSNAPSTCKDFDKVYNSSLFHWMWTDIRIPKELKEIVEIEKPETSLEMGCGLGRFSTYTSSQGIKSTAVDFSSVAIDKAKKRIDNKEQKPDFFVGDVTNLSMLQGPYDLIFDVGCFHCLNKEGQKKYISESYRLLETGSTLLIWALDSSPSGIKLNPEYMSVIFENGSFKLAKAKFSRRRIIASHWYWFIRK